MCLQGAYPTKMKKPILLSSWPIQNNKYNPSFKKAISVIWKALDLDSTFNRTYLGLGDILCYW